VFFQPGSTRLSDAVAQTGKIRGAMGVRIDADEHALILA
jgi:hypothetical protein